MGSYLDSLRAEAAQLEQLIESLPAAAFLDRLSLEQRLAEVKRLMDEAANLHETDPFLMTFRGPPVESTNGIQVDFAGKALQKFSDAFQTVAAGQKSELNPRGRLPVSEAALMLTGTAIGSFGFEFNAPRETMFPDVEPAGIATLDALLSVIRSATDENDEELAGAIENVQQRAVTKIREFLEFVAQQETGVTFALGSSKLVLSDSIELRKIVDRLQHTNIREETIQSSVVLLGVLPIEGTFEARPLDDSDVLKGKISNKFEDLEEFSREWSFKRVQLELLLTQVGNRAPKYVLTDIKAIE